MLITPASTVKDILTACPELFDVFLARGMCESCQDSPPPVPLHIFAIKHCGGDIEGLIEELETSRSK
jgi:hypothetical protein